MRHPEVTAASSGRESGAFEKRMKLRRQIRFVQKAMYYLKALYSIKRAPSSRDHAVVRLRSNNFARTSTQACALHVLGFLQESWPYVYMSIIDV